jgi:hypothetical protein
MEDCFLTQNSTNRCRDLGRKPLQILAQPQHRQVGGLGLDHDVERRQAAGRGDKGGELERVDVVGVLAQARRDNPPRLAAPLRNNVRLDRLETNGKCSHSALCCRNSLLYAKLNRRLKSAGGCENQAMLFKPLGLSLP